jgi:P27 family predicted phage terminase small subunit
MARGRKTKPTILKVQNGSAKKNKGRMPEGEPQRPRGYPIKPTGISREAGAEWKRVCDELDELQVLATTDRALLDVYARTYDLMLVYERELKRIGPITECMTEWGVTYKVNPAAVRIESNRKTLIRILAELGLSPTSNARLRVQGGQEEADRLTEIFG